MTTCSLRGGSWNDGTHFGPANLHCRSTSRGCDFSECLAHKWGLTANLPSDHPYKVSPPTDSETGFRVICPERTFLRGPVRGGSIYGPATALRARARGFAPVAQDTCIMGFRVAYLPPEVTP